MIRPQSVVLPILRSALPGVAVVSAIPDVDHRTLPMVVIRRAGGARHPSAPRRFALPVLELAAVSADGLVEAEELYEDALEALYAAVRQQITVEGVGYLHSINEQQGPAEADPRIPDAWSVEGQIRVGLRPSAAA